MGQHFCIQARRPREVVNSSPFLPPARLSLFQQEPRMQQRVVNVCFRHKHRGRHAAEPGVLTREL